MEIYILEDNLPILLKTKDLIQDLIGQLAITNCQIISCQKKTSLLEKLETASVASLYILDIEIQGQNTHGIDLATKIRSQDPDAVIVFYSSYSKHMGLAFKSKVGAYNFINKQEDPDEVKNQFKEAIIYTRDLNQDIHEGQLVSFTVDQKVIELRLDDILYLESFKGRVYIQSKGREPISFFASLTDIEEQIPQLYRTHRTYLVNPANVKEYNRKNRQVIMANDDLCSVSKARESGLLELLQEKTNYIQR